MNHFNSAYSILGLAPGSPREKVVARYKRLAKVWAPERFPSIEEKRDAEAELEKIIDACTFLVSHFDSDDHHEDDCECLPREDLEDEQEERRIEKTKTHRKRRNLEDERDQRFAARLEGRGYRRSERAIDDEAEDGGLPQKRGISEKTVNFIVVAIAAVVLFAGWLSSMGPSTSPNPVPQALAPQMPAAQGQNQQMNPLQQLLRSSDEQAPQSSEERSQQSTPEQAPPQEPPQEQSQQTSE